MKWQYGTIELTEGELRRRKCRIPVEAGDRRPFLVQIRDKRGWHYYRGPCRDFVESYNVANLPRAAR